MDYIKEIVTGSISLLFLVLQFLIIAIVKKQKRYAAFNEVYSLLPTFINSAECYGFKDGVSKKRYVLDLACSVLSTRLKMTCENVVKNYGDLISVKVEEILSTPTKKEVANAQTNETKDR